VDPVDEEVGEENEERKLQIVVGWERCIVKSVVKFSIALYLQHKEAGCKEGHSRHR